LRLSTIRAGCALAALAAGFPSAAGTASGSVGVNITLSQPGAAGTGAPAGSGICISQSLSEQTGAVVRVICETGQFVSIGPRPGGRFIDTHGGAYTYSFGPLLGAASRESFGEFANGTGTITSFRVYSVDGADGPLDMLVSF